MEKTKRKPINLDIGIIQKLLSSFEFHIQKERKKEKARENNCCVGFCKCYCMKCALLFSKQRITWRFDFQK